jgi:hypothetical protein
VAGAEQGLSANSTRGAVADGNATMIVSTSLPIVPQLGTSSL